MEKAIITIDKEDQKFYLKHGYNIELYKVISTMENCFWIKPTKTWVFKGTNEKYAEVITILKNKGIQYTVEYVKSIEDAETNPIVKRYIKAIKMKNYSINTVRAYTPWFRGFVNNFFSRDIDKLSHQEIFEYIKTTVKDCELDDSQKKLLVCSIKFYYEKILGYHKILFYVAKQNKIEVRDIVMGFNELQNELNKLEKPGEQLLLILKYGIGLSFNEIAGLTLEMAKGLLQLPKVAEEPEMKKGLYKVLAQYYEAYKPLQYLFETKCNTKIDEEIIKTKIRSILKNKKLVLFYRAEFSDLLKQSNYKDKTRSNYLTEMVRICINCNYKHLEDIDNKEIEDFLWRLRKSGKSSTNTISQYISVVKFYYQEVIKREIPPHQFFRPKMEKKLPVILNYKEINDILLSIRNLKQRCMLALIYSAGIRKSELLDIKLNHLDFERKMLRIKKGKGSKDRETILSDTLKAMLKEYIEQFKPKDYLFEGALGGRYGESSLQKVMQNALKKSGVSKNVSLHNLRHSFATHLLENGTDIRIIQKLLGHSSIETTTIYAQVANKTISNVVSPFDSMQQKIQADKETWPDE